jgi:enoyl-CoA hydratase/carnithine racemase
MQEIQSNMQALDANSDVRAIVVTGNEKSFSAGADVKEITSLTTVAEAYNREWLQELDNMVAIRTPTIAAVNGFCFGGGMGLAASCDFIIAGEGATFTIPEIEIGTFLLKNISEYLLAHMKRYKFMEALLTAKQYNAQEALSLGLVNQVLPPEQVVDEAIEKAKKIAQMDPKDVAFVKSLTQFQM